MLFKKILSLLLIVGVSVGSSLSISAGNSGSSKNCYNGNCNIREFYNGIMLCINNNFLEKKMGKLASKLLNIINKHNFDIKKANNALKKINEEDTECVSKLKETFRKKYIFYYPDNAINQILNGGKIESQMASCLAVGIKDSGRCSCNNIGNSESARVDSHNKKVEKGEGSQPDTSIGGCESKCMTCNTNGN